MKRKSLIFIAVLITASAVLAGCGQADALSEESVEQAQKGASYKAEDSKENSNERGTKNKMENNTQKQNSQITLTSEVISLDKGLSAVKYEGRYGFEEFLAKGGASSDAEVAQFLTRDILFGQNIPSFGSLAFGCSTISVKDKDGSALFGRNFDWNACSAMIVQSVPETGYASISTVNTDFINMSGFSMAQLPDSVQAIVALYAPLDGMNEKGLAVSVNMIQDSSGISQNTDKPDITTTTAIRLLLDRAADTDEAVKLLSGYDMHASMGYMMHLALSDAAGRSVVVEYIDNEMVVTETPVVTNFYLAKGKKNGIGTAQSHERYDILMKSLKEKRTMNMDEVRDALDSVSKDNFGEFESTEWSIVFNQNTGEVHYYHRENYQDRYVFRIKTED